MAKSLHVNTPEETMYEISMENYSQVSQSNRKRLIEQLQVQLAHNQLQRTRPRDYLRILGQSGTPAKWYKATTTSRSVYFYDPNYQKQAEKQSNNLQKSNPNLNLTSSQSNRIHEPLINRSHSIQRNSHTFLAPRSKYLSDLYSTAINYHQRKTLSTKNYQTKFSNLSPKGHGSLPDFKSASTLPAIHSSKGQSNEPLTNSFYKLNKNLYYKV